MHGYNFTESVRRALANARTEAAALHHEYVGTEHILLGLLSTNDGMGCAMIDALGVDRVVLRESIINTVKPGRTFPTGPDLPYTSRAKKVLELSMSEARDLHHTYVGTEHLVLGLLREEKGIAAQVLGDAGISIDGARVELMRLVNGPPGAAAPVARRATSSPRQPDSLPRRLRQVVATAHDVAAEHQSLQLTATHMMIGLLRHGDGLGNAVLDRLGLDRPAALSALELLAPRGGDVVGPDDVVALHRELSVALDAMAAYQAETRSATPGTHHLLVALLETSTEVASVLAQQGIDAARLREEIRRISG